jgi:hypothetical protein
MKRTTALFLIAGVALASTACTEAKRARNAATFGDQPADITCWTYGTQTFSGRSTGKVEYNDGGRIAFVDAANGRYTTIDGECRVVYVPEGEAATAAAAPVVPGGPGGPVAPPPAVPEA